MTAHQENEDVELPQGNYLIGKVGEISGNLSDIIILGMDDWKKELVYEDGNLYMNISAYDAGIKTWMGGETALWDLDNTTAFKNNETSVEDVFVPGDEVIFDDSALTTDVEINGRLKPSSVTFSNNDKDYTLSGDGQIVGNAKLVKEGNGTLTINNINSYTGGTYIKGGKLVAGVFSNNVGNDLGALSDVNSRIYISDDAILSASASGTLGQRISISSGDAAIEVPGGVTLTTAQGITGGGIGQKLYKKGEGTLQLATGNTVSRLVIEDGTVIASEANNVTSLPSTVEFVNGVLRDPDTMYSYSSNPTNYYVGEGNKGALYFDSRCTYTGKLTGSGTFSIYATNVRTDLTGDWSGFEGELICGTQKTGSYDPDLKWDNNYGLPKATLNIPSGVTFNAQDRNIKLGNIKGNGTFYGTGTLTIGNDDKAINYSGSFSGKPKLVKTGKCDLNMSKLISGIASLSANDGTVSLNASKSPYNTTFLAEPLTIEGNAKLRGRGTVGNITVSANGVIEPGSFSETNSHHYGAIFSTGDVTVNEGATLSLYLRVAGKNNDCSYLDVKGGLTVNGNIVVAMNPEYAPAVGDEFRLWVTDKFNGTPNIELPELPSGLAWDFAGLQDSTGILKVVEGPTTGVSAISEGASVVCKVYDTVGICIGTVETTKAEASKAVKSELNLGEGLYILVFEADGVVETIKVQL